MKQYIFLITVIITLGIFFSTVMYYVKLFKITRPFPIGQFGKRFRLMMEVAIGQTKIFRFPFSGVLHALVFWGFLVILIGSIEMIIDGLTGTDRILSFLGIVYTLIIASGDIFAVVVALAVIVFLLRRLIAGTKRFTGTEMKEKSHLDAFAALMLILLLMLTLTGMNMFYYVTHPDHSAGLFPVSKILAQYLIIGNHHPMSVQYEALYTRHEVFWWSHILLVFLFANILPYSKHFHVFMSVPNVFLSRLEPLGYLPNMPAITKEVKMMLDSSAQPEAADSELPPSRFGVLDIEDITWKNYLDSLTCTECGRCTSVCPANITGKKLSPRKIIMDVRARMKEKGPGIIKNGKDFTDQKALIGDYISEEELWACTTCNACANECPVNINHPTLIVDMRRYLVMEKAAGPGELNAMFTNVENNGAPWQFSPEDRLLWADTPELQGKIPLMQKLIQEGNTPEYLFWVGSAGAFDDRYKKVSREFVKILNHLGISYAVLGKEETDSGDAARRAGNEMLFQMQALMNIQVFEQYGIKKIITCCPHDYNTFKNEYPDLGGKYEVIHHSQFLREQMVTGKLKMNGSALSGKTITYHDPCYLGRANGEYKAAREVITRLPVKFTEMKRNRSFALCCGAGGGQMFKEAEKGNKEVFIERMEDALETRPDIIVTSCPFCMVMLTDGIKYKNKEEEIVNYDLAELVSIGMGL